MTTDLAAACALDDLGGGRFGVDPTRSWWAIGALHGGYVLALAVAAVEQALGCEGLALHHLSLHYLRPVLDEPLTIEVEEVRRGRRLANGRVTLRSGDRVLVDGIASVAARADGDDLAVVAPPVVEPYDPAGGDPSAPAKSIQSKVWMQPRISEGDPAAPWRVGGWVAPRSEEVVDHRWLAILADLWTPPVYRAWDRPRPSTTVDLTYHARNVLPRPELPPGSPVLVVASNRVQVGGLVDEDVEIWSAGGLLLAQARQTRLAVELP